MSRRRNNARNRRRRAGSPDPHLPASAIAARPSDPTRLRGEAGIDSVRFTPTPELADDPESSHAELDARQFAELHRIHKKHPTKWSEAIDTRTMLYMSMALFVGLLVYAILRWLDNH
jgi:hypothetical protein